MSVRHSGRRGDIGLTAIIRSIGMNTTAEITRLIRNQSRPSEKGVCSIGSRRTWFGPRQYSRRHSNSRGEGDLVNGTCRPPPPEKRQRWGEVSRSDGGGVPRRTASRLLSCPASPPPPPPPGGPPPPRRGG